MTTMTAPNPRYVPAAIFYGAALFLIYIGVQIAPAQGWPTNDVEVGGCCILVFGMIAKLAGHAALLTREA